MYDNEQVMLRVQKFHAQGLLGVVKKDPKDSKAEMFFKELRRHDFQTRLLRAMLSQLYLGVLCRDEERRRISAISDDEKVRRSIKVEMATHPGFVGGLDKRGTTGKTSIYAADALYEIMFHVVTLMPTKVVGEELLGALVRETALNASRARRSLNATYMGPLGTRRKLIRDIIGRYSNRKTQDDAAKVVVINE
eukprot:jgi/Bigna1/66465/fgenesh1_pg.1_\